MEKHLIISDLDGTLADSDHNVNETTKQAIRNILDQGHIFYIATGRMKGLVAQVAEDIDPRVRIIASNGGVLETPTGTEKIPLVQSEQEKIFNIIKENDVPALFFSEFDVLYSHFIPEFFSEINSYHMKHKLNPIIKQINSFDELKEFNIINALLMGQHLDDPQSILLPTRKILLNDVDINVTSSNEANIELYSKKASKGNAIKKVQSFYDIPLSNVICFGDGHNDVSMFEVVPNSVAMDNAPQEVKEYAKFQTKANTENGVAHFLHQYFK